MKFLDQAKVFIRSGNGGAGCVGFRREKFIEFGGPDGGDGGKGGDVIAQCVDGLNTLIDYRYAQHFKAETGHHGMGSQRTGGKGKDVVLRLPRGTQIFDEDNETLLADRAVKLAMTDRVGHVDPRPQHRHRISALHESCPMGGTIDAAGHPAYDRNTAPDERPHEHAGDPFAVRGRVPCPDYRDPRFRQRRLPADGKQFERGVGEVAELDGVFR